MKIGLNKIRDFFLVENRKYSLFYTWFLVVLALFIVYYVWVITVIPVMNYKYIIPENQVKKSRQLSHDFSSYYSIDDSLKTKSIDIAQKEAFLLACMEISRDDTISLAVDLSDSTVTLMVQGISIFSSRITNFKYSSMFRRMDPIRSAEFFSWPFKIKDYSSSVPKVPIIIRKAPKDTIEAATLPEPGRLEENSQFVSFHMNLDRNLSLSFEQDTISDEIDKRTIRRYLHQLKKVKRRSIRKALIRSGSLNFLPEIKIWLNREDALAVFRALPENVNIAIKISSK